MLTFEVRGIILTFSLYKVSQKSIPSPFPFCKTIDVLNYITEYSGIKQLVKIYYIIHRISRYFNPTNYRLDTEIFLMLSSQFIVCIIQIQLFNSLKTITLCINLRNIRVGTKKYETIKWESLFFNIISFKFILQQ